MGVDRRFFKERKTHGHESNDRVHPPSKRVVVSFGGGTGVPPVNGHGHEGRATANDTTTGKRISWSKCAVKC